VSKVLSQFLQKQDCSWLIGQGTVALTYDGQIEAIYAVSGPSDAKKPCTKVAVSLTLILHVEHKRGTSLHSFIALPIGRYLLSRAEVGKCLFGKGQFCTLRVQKMAFFEATHASSWPR
jgi:hypothetical protein